MWWIRFLWNILDWMAPAAAVSAFAAMLFGGYGILAAFVLEVAFVWIRGIYFLPMDTGMEGLAMMVASGYLIVANLIVFAVYKIGKRLKSAS